MSIAKDLTDEGDRIALLEGEIERLRERLSEATRREARAASLQGVMENRSILDVVPSGIVHVSSVGSILYANAEAQHILGLTYDELTDRYVSDFEGETFREDGSVCPVSEYPVSQCLSTGKPQPPKVIGVKMPDGAVVWALFSAIPTPADEQGRTGALITFVDISELHRAREDQRHFAERINQAQKMEALGRLAGGMAHDMNNILASVIGLTSAVKDELSVASVHQDDLQIILASCRRGRDLLQGLMGFARNTQATSELFNFNAICQEANGLLSRILPRSIALNLTLDPELIDVKGDPNQMSHVLMNLCLNAADAINGSGQINLSTQNLKATREHPFLKEDCCYVLFQIQDTGSGMTEAVKKQAFDPFFTTKPKGEGTGLGLFMVYAAVTSQGGQVHIDSEPGRGTIITIAMQVESFSTPPKTTGSNPELAALKRASVLLIDADRLLLRAHWRVLRSLGHDVRIAATGGSALETFTAYHREIGLVLLDTMVPGGHREVLHSLRQIDPRVRVLLTAVGVDQRLRDEARGLGVAGFLPKPFELETIGEQIERAMEEGQE